MPRPGRRQLDPVAVIVFFTAISTILLLLSTLSVPFIKFIYLFRLGATTNGVWRYVDFGIFGYCPMPLGGKKVNCTKPALGWEIGKDITDALQVQSTLQGGLQRYLTYLLILGPAASVLAFVAFLVSAVIYSSRPTPKLGPGGTLTNLAKSSRRFKAICTAAQVALSCATLTLIIDIVVLTTIKDHVSSLASGTSNLKSSSGGVVWSDAIAWFFLLLSTLTASRLRRVAIQSEAAAKRDSQMPSAEAYEIYHTPQPHYHPLPVEQQHSPLPLPLPLQPPQPQPPQPQPPSDPHRRQTDDAPPPYTVTAPSDATTPPDTLVIEDPRPFNLFGNVSHV